MSDIETGDIETTDDVVADAPQLSEVEQLAADMGWRPETEWKGDKTKWRGANEFIKNTRTDRNLEREIKSLKDKMERTERATGVMMDRALKEQADTINARFREAVENKDSAGAAEAAKDMRKLEADMAASKSTGNAEEDFARANSWYGRDEDATAYAISVSQREAGKGKSVEEQLEAATKAVQKRFPELFDDEAALTTQPKVPTLSAPGRSVGSTKAKTFENLPSEARSAAETMAKHAKTQFGKDPAEFRKEYAAEWYRENAG